MKYKGILIVGPMGAGKDTLAGKLSDAIRRICCPNIYKLGRVIRDTVSIVSQYDCGVKVHRREYYQDFGQSVRQCLGVDVWNYITLDQIELDRLRISDMFPIIADGRQLNEVGFWRKQGFLTIGIDAPETIRKARLVERDGYLPDKEAFTHDTELQAVYAANHKCDLCINNVFDELHTLGLAVDEILEKLGGEQSV